MLLCRDLYDPGAVMQKTGGKYIMVKAVVGANWGDEGKGKITDMLAADSSPFGAFASFAPM